MASRISRDAIDHFHVFNLYIPKRLIVIKSEETNLEGAESGVDANMADRLIKNLEILDGMSQDPITIIMNNPGGDTQHGLAIYDAIKASKSHITIKVFGSAMSMGGVVLQAADERIMSPNSKFMMHYGHFGMTDVSKSVHNWSEENKKTNKWMEQMFLEKIRQKHPDYKLKKVQEMCNFDTILNAREAVLLGLADKILGEE